MILVLPTGRTPLAWQQDLLPVGWLSLLHLSMRVFLLTAGRVALH